MRKRTEGISWGARFMTYLGVTLAGAFWVSQASLAQGPAYFAGEGTSRAEAMAGESTSVAATIPHGTILPVVLRSTLTLDKLVPGAIIEGKIAQQVPLSNGQIIRRGSRVEGHVVEITPSKQDASTKVLIRFDKVISEGQTIPITTDLRALAGFMEVAEAGVPEESASEGTPGNWLTTTQIGGDAVYGMGGPVMSAENTSEQIGTAVGDGVLVKPAAKQGTRCRGAVEGNSSTQALWVFSSDACGTYGLSNVKIVHAGRTDPVGTIILETDRRNLRLHSGDGLLLRVIG